MNPTAIFWPVIAHVALTYGIYFMVLRRRVAAIRGGAASISSFRDRGAEPTGSATAANNLLNQFELPVLFHAVCLALYVTGGVSIYAVILAWMFSVSRYVHTWIHLTHNSVRTRQAAFIAGFVATAILWLIFATHIALG